MFAFRCLWKQPPLAYLLLISIISFCTACNSNTPTKDTEFSNLLQSIQVRPDKDCNQTIEGIQSDWAELAVTYNNDALFYKQKGNQACYWTRIVLMNSDTLTRKRALYFPKGWSYLDTYIFSDSMNYYKQRIGVKQYNEVLPIQILPLDSLIIYVHYPEEDQAFYPSLYVREMLEETYQEKKARNRLKYLFIGAWLFPLLFFLAQFITQKDQLSFFYLLFMLGSAIYLLTMFDTIPFFELNSKFIKNMQTIARLFVISTLLTFTGLVKYIHLLLDIAYWHKSLLRIGNILLLLFTLIAVIPFLFPIIFHNDHYDSYLQFFRVGVLVLFIYILYLCTWAMLKRLPFSRILLLAFSPFILSGIWYAMSFLVLNNYSQSSIESLVLIGGFMLTLMLFGVVLGVRNNAVQKEKLQLEQQTERLKELDEFKNRFYTNFTHEFRTPLTVIKGMASLIRGNEKEKKHIQENSNHLLYMVNQLLDLSKVESNKLSIDWVQQDVIRYLRYLTESYHSLASDKYLNLAFFSKEQELMMDIDEKKLKHILLNLLSNAIKFTPDYGSVKVIVAKVVEAGKPYLELVVQDTGKGISPDEMPYIFDRFYQVDSSATRQAEGFGIGLALVKELVQLLHGHVEVESEFGKGTRFKVYLPIDQKAKKKDFLPTAPSNENGTETTSTVHQNVIPENEKPLVLVIEDNIDVTEYIIACLSPNYQLQTARNGKEGLEKAFALIPDVILCDVMMPEMDGFEVTRRLKMDQRSSHIPIIILTAKATQEDKLLGLKQGADAYLTKPFDKEELLIRLKNLSVQSKRLREVLSIESPTYVSEIEKKEAAFLKQLREIIETNMGEESFDTEFLCRSIAMSRTQLHRKLKALTGQPTATFIRKSRLQEAKKMIMTTDLPIGEIALSVGFKDFSHFSRSFNKEFDARPSSFRN